MKKRIWAALAALLLAGCFTIPEDQVIYYATALPEGYTESNTVMEDAPDTVSVLGKKLDRKMVDNFDSVETLEANWDTHKADYLRRGPNFWSDNAASIENGYLKLETKSVSFETLGIPLTEEIKKTCRIESASEEVIISGAVRSREQYKYGLFVGRLRLNKETNGHWHAFWSYIHGVNVPGFDKEVGYEFDVFEFHRMNSSYPKEQVFDQTTHYNYGGRRHSYKHKASAPDISEWNTFAVLWTPDEYVYYVNWEPTYYVSRTGGDLSGAKQAALAKTGNALIPDVPMDFYFSTEVAKGVGWATLWAGVLQESKLPDSLDVDYFARYSCDEWEALR